MTSFAEEAVLLLVDMEQALLTLEIDPSAAKAFDSLCHALQALKASALSFGFPPMAAFTHEAEALLDAVRYGESPLGAELISTLFDSKDHIAKLITQGLANRHAALPLELETAGKRLLERLAGGPAGIIPARAADETLLESEGGGEITVDDSWLISLEFRANAFRNGMDPLPFIRYLKTLGEIKGMLTAAPGMPAGEAMDPETCYLRIKIAFQSDAGKQTLESVFEFADQDCDIKILPPNSKAGEYLRLLAAQDSSYVRRLGEMLVQAGALTQTDVKLALQTQSTAGAGEHAGPTPKPLGEILVAQQVVRQPVVAQALKIQEQTKQNLAAEASYIRVDAGKLGHLINLVGELVTASAAMNLLVERHNLGDAADIAAGINLLVNGIRNTALELRMVQIGETFTRFRRVVRDVSQELNKDIELIISGGETELDKTVVERINDPLMHLIRNALDHGIETPERRLAAGKPATGTVRLNAYHHSGRIIIQIADDGAGLNREKIAAKAIANGLIPPEHDLSRQEIYNLIFAPGLSTKEQASNLSGRGVGMDVVKKNIEALRGSVGIDSVEGQGTTITIELPLTLAIIDGFMVGVGRERYIIPLGMVEECIEMASRDAASGAERHYLNLREQVLPCLRLGDYFAHSRQGIAGKRESIVVVKSGQARAGFVVDELHGEHQTVIKPLGNIFEKLQGIAGATVLGDGTIALILDVQSLIQNVIADRSQAGRRLGHQA